VVDDVLMNRDIAASILRAAGHSAVCVEGGAEAVELATREDFDVVLMDVRMPGMDGLEAARRIRALAGVRGLVPIIAVTAQTFAEQVTECREAGMGSHLAKPFDPERLVTAVVEAFAAGPRHGEDHPRTGTLSAAAAVEVAEHVIIEVTVETG
jgi:CheY-like chemotaxis protein